MHQAPDVMNYRTRARGPKVRPGLCVAIEPMLIQGPGNWELEDDDWQLAPPPRPVTHPADPAGRRPAGASATTYVRARRRERWIAPAAGRLGALHAGAWWLWALGLATAASRTTNPLLLGLIVGVAGYVVAARRTAAPWARSYGAFVKLGLVVIGLRLVFSMLLGSPIPGSHVLFTLPEVPEVGVAFARAEGEKCDRCWKVLPDVGDDPAHPTLCLRCADAVEHLPEAAE